jgi:hypothetical protein
MIAVNSDEEEKSRRPQQEGPWPRRLDPLLQLLAHVPQGQSAFNSLSMSASADRAIAPTQDKAVRRFTVRNMVESAAIRDLSDASVYSGELSCLADAP